MLFAAAGSMTLPHSLLFLTLAAVIVSDRQAGLLFGQKPQNVSFILSLHVFLLLPNIVVNTKMLI